MSVNGIKVLKTKLLLVRQKLILNLSICDKPTKSYENALFHISMVRNLNILLITKRKISPIVQLVVIKHI